MKKLLVTILAVAFTLPVFAQESENYIQVTGVSEIEIVPNQIYLTIVLDESDSKGRQAIENQRREMVNALKKIGINTEKNLTMENMSSSYYKRGNALSKASYQLLLTSSEQVVKVYDALAVLNISDVNITRVSHTDIEQFKSKCRKEAMINAKTVASELAEAVGQTIGACIYIYDSNRGVTPTYYNDRIVMRSMAKVANEEAVIEEEPIEFKKIKLNYSVNAKFRINE
ncbi:MAG: SIMPL domain-containing protein [Alistipes sp.]|nr:SIMPL domain-containing protein [Alistipes sp.]MBQ9962289.1 SIMPL domain-containing protein [Alistipes sp.]